MEWAFVNHSFVILYTVLVHCTRIHNIHVPSKQKLYSCYNVQRLYQIKTVADILQERN